MVETEMTIQLDSILPNQKSKPPDINSGIETIEEDKNDIQLGIITNELNKENNIKKHANSDQLLPLSKEKNQKYFFKKLGNTYSFFGDIYGNPKIIIGPHWYFYALVTFYFSLGFFFEIYFLGKYTSILLNILGFLIFFTFLFSYSYTALINPGYPKHDIDSITGEPRNMFYFCSTCKMWVNRDKKTLHCSDCNICIEKLDHHCPWTGKCIGDKNLISYYIFVVSIFLLFIHFGFVFAFIDKEQLFS